MVPSEICNMEYKFFLVACNILMTYNIKPMPSSKSRPNFVAERMYMVITPHSWMSGSSAKNKIAFWIIS